MTDRFSDLNGDGVDDLRVSSQYDDQGRVVLFTVDVPVLPTSSNETRFFFSDCPGSSLQARALQAATRNDRLERNNAVSTIRAMLLELPIARRTLGL